MNIRSAQSVSSYFKTMQLGKEPRANMGQSRSDFIRQSLVSGKKLRTDEMVYLQQSDQGLYNQAMSLSLERQAYEDELRQSRSKSDANNYNMYKLMQIAGQLKYGSSDEALMRTNAIQEAHREFMRSSKYASLR